jgi:L-lactate dehydrogenase
MKQTKISIIGAGAVGSSIAYALLLKNIPAKIQLIDTDQSRCQGESMDLVDALTFCGSSLITSGTIKDTYESDIIIIAAGQRQKIGQDRISLYSTNKDIISSIMHELKPIHQNSIIIMVTNPLDLLVLQAQKESGLPKSRIFGTGTFLDTQRLRDILSKKLGCASESIHAYVLGEHGDTQFPAWSCSSVAGIPLTQLIDQKELNKIGEETKNKASDIISCKGATHWGIATCTATICQTIIFDKKRVTPLSVYLEQFGLYLSMPAVLGANGIEKILTIPLDQKEQEKLAYSAAALKRLL